MLDYWFPTGHVAGRILLLVAIGSTLVDVAAQGPEPSDTHGLATNPQENWPSFRGPRAIGHARQVKPPLKWNAADGTGVLWRITLPKHGMSSPVCRGSRVFLTGADEDSRQLYCVDAFSGKLLWQHDVQGVPGSPDDGKIP
ncbi:MAG: PQQ-binding-like beta-propeller repeat protein, partial [Planctomycetales bacterium]|nr:PQQ-binding-like beta-propeller repeat protein [Planctomycetales bacterium]